MNQNENKENNYPCCGKCSEYFLIKFVNQQIKLFCDNCSYCEAFDIDNDLITKIFKTPFPQKIECCQNIKCDKCNKVYCSYCYNKHEDVLINGEFQEKDPDNDNIESEFIIEKKKYSNYNIKCDKCKRKYTLDIINPYIKKKPSLWMIKQNLQKAEDYLKNYYCKLKHNIDLELNEKNEKIEKAFSYNYNYHIILFELIHSLINIYESNKNFTIYESIVNLTNFNFPTLDFPLEIELNKKIIQLYNFFSTKFMNFEKNLEQELFSQNYNIKNTKNYYGSLVLFKNKYIYYGGAEISIHNLFDFQMVARLSIIELGIHVGLDIVDICVLNEKELLVSSSSCLYICTFNGYNDKATILELYYFSIIEKIFINKDKHIVTCSMDTIKIRNNFHPYDLIKEIKIDFLVMNFYLLDNDRMVIVEEQEDKNKASIGVLDLKTGLTTKTPCKYEFDGISFFKEISEQKIIINALYFTYIYNHIINQIESIIIGGNEDSPLAVLNNLFIKGVIITECSGSFFFYDETTLQKIFELKQPKKKISHLITLSNGTIQGLYQPLFSETESEDKESKMENNQIEHVSSITVSTYNKYDSKTLLQSSSINISL